MIASIIIICKYTPIRFTPISTEDFNGSIIYKDYIFSTIPHMERFDLLQKITLVWMISSLGFLFIRLVFNYIQIKLILNNSSKIEDKNIQNLVLICQRELHITKTIPLFISTKIRSPALCGILSPKLLLNTLDYSETELKFIIKHELIHYRQHDTVFRLLANIAQCINWFNPIIYFFELSFYDLGEMACDEKVLEKMSLKERGLYARLLLHLSNDTNNPLFIASIFCNSESRMERRIYYIMKQNLKKQKAWITGALIGIMTFSFPAVVYASNQGVLFLQNQLIMEPITTVEYSDSTVPIAEEFIVENYSLNNTISENLPVTRGSNSVYAEIGSGESYVFNSTKLSVGDTVEFALVSNNGGNFSAGIIDSNNAARMVNSSSNGIISSSLSIRKDDTYRVVISNRSSSDIIVSGNISIK